MDTSGSQAGCGPTLAQEASAPLALCRLPGYIQMASGSTPGLIWQGLSGELASEKVLGTGNCWNKKDEC